MIDDDPPLAVDLPEEKGIDAADITGLSLEEPFSDHEIIVSGQSFYSKKIEEEFAHLIGAVIILPVVSQCLMIAVAGAGFADKNKGIIIPVAFHEGGDIAFIPGLHLISHDLTDGRLIFGRLGERGRGQG